MALCVYCKNLLALLGQPYTGEFSHQTSFDALRLSHIKCEICNLFMVSFQHENKVEEIVLKEKQGHSTAITIRGYGDGDFLEYSIKEWTDLEQIHVVCGWISNSSPGVDCVFALYSDESM